MDQRLAYSGFRPSGKDHGIEIGFGDGRSQNHDYNKFQLSMISLPIMLKILKKFYKIVSFFRHKKETPLAQYVSSLPERLIANRGEYPSRWNAEFYALAKKNKLPGFEG